MRRYRSLGLLFALLLGSVYSPSSLAQDKPPPAAGAGSSCKLADKASPQDFIVWLDPDTIWRPRNGSVHLMVKNNTAPCRQITAVNVDFQWSKIQPSDTWKCLRATPSDLHAPVASPRVSSINNNNGTAIYEAVVPNLADVCSSWVDRIRGHSEVASIGLYSVPLADMIVKISLADQSEVDVPVSFGVTSVSFAVVLVIVAVGLFFGGAWLVLRGRPLPGNPPADAPPPSLPLRIVMAKDGYGSLSQFQIILWTLVVGASAVYVIVLSGNLIDITDGTLTLLGIAGGTAVLGRIPVKPDGAKGPAAAPVQPAPGAPGPAPAAHVAVPAAPAAAAQPAVIAADVPPADPATAVPPPAAPPPAAAQTPLATAPTGRTHQTSWADLVTDGDDGIDVTRIQMLVFTVITAVFVVLKVVVGYVIPEIPTNFLLLMGISNGVYITGKHLPDRTGGGNG